MGAPLGSKNALGNSGGKKGLSGRKSAYEEVARALDAHSMFFEEQSQEELERKIQSGTFSIKDRFLLTAMEGDSSVINKAYQKAVPDNIQMDVRATHIVFMPPEIAEKNGVDLVSDINTGAENNSAGQNEVSSS